MRYTWSTGVTLTSASNEDPRVSRLVRRFRGPGRDERHGGPRGIGSGRLKLSIPARRQYTAASTGSSWAAAPGLEPTTAAAGRRSSSSQSSSKRNRSPSSSSGSPTTRTAVKALGSVQSQRFTSCRRRDSERDASAPDRSSARALLSRNSRLAPRHYVATRPLPGCGRTDTSPRRTLALIAEQTRDCWIGRHPAGSE